ncbi:PREDICTED: importin-9-like [Priapulus caudatus]|uniref:Importin-9-like n=1 Tax=Priapulus caudatus TaxID=37621 RepID=A0ABM1EA20_PRICU|nr:PREDICTED: importin-9-like [Priapulus caudatus]
MASSIAGDVSRSLKEVLYETLTAILSPDHNVRVAAEEQIKALEVTEEFGVHLSEFTVDPNGPLAIRQLSSVLLKQYVEVHWSVHSEKFRAPETTDQAKAAIRHMIPVGLTESISKVRSSVAYAISAIAHWDWPDAWPELFQQLMHTLTTGDQNAVHGTMRVLTEFMREVTGVNQVPQITPVILPEMYKIFTRADAYSIRTRSRAVVIFTTCASMIADMEDMDKRVKGLIYPFLPQFTEAFVQSLQVPDSATSDSGLKMEVLKALTALVKNFPKQMAPYMNTILQSVWITLTESATIIIALCKLIQHSITSNDARLQEIQVKGDQIYAQPSGVQTRARAAEAPDRWTVVPILVKMYKLIINELSNQMETNISKSLDDGQDDDCEVHLWTNSPDQFVEDEDEDTFSYSVRISAQDLLLTLSSEFQCATATGICSATMRHLHEAETTKNSGTHPYWWKIHEACMLTLGSVKDLIIEQLQEKAVTFDVVGFLQNVVLADLNAPVSPFLLGRALWVASRFAMLMPAEVMQRFLQSTVAGLQDTQPSSVRISAARAVFGFSEHLKSLNSTQVILPYLEPIMHGLVTLATQFSADVLALVLETICIVVSVDKEFTASCEAKAVPLTIAIFLKYNSDPLIAALCQDIFKVYAQNEVARPMLHQRLLPTINSILQAPADKVPPGMPSNALDVLCIMVRHCSKPLPDIMITEAFPSAARCTLSTDDNATMQSGGECLRAFVSVACDQISLWQDEQGRHGLWYFVHMFTGTPCTFVTGRVHCVLQVRRALINRFCAFAARRTTWSSLLSRAVLSKMQQADTLSVICSVLYGVMCCIQCVVPGLLWSYRLCRYSAVSSGETTWQLLLRCRAQQDRQQADTLFTCHEGVLLLSKDCQQADTLFSVMQEESDEELGEGEDGDDPSMQTLQDLLAPAEDYAGYDFDANDNDDDEDDEDALNDPLYQVNLQQYLMEFLRELSQQPYYSTFSAHHTDCERKVLANIGINA